MPGSVGRVYQADSERLFRGRPDAQVVREFQGFGSRWVVPP